MRRAHRTHGLAILASAGMLAVDTPMPPRGEYRTTPRNPARRGEHMDVTVEPDALDKPRLPLRSPSTGATDLPAARTTP